MPVKLLLETLQDMKSRIHMQNLPKNFQHAISITRGMGIPYLWIDSLCIIQDSPSDWDKEASTMGQVYMHATCVISATASADFNGGCFYDRCSLDRNGPRPSMPRSVLAWDYTYRTGLIARTSVSEDISLTRLFDTHVETAAISGRAWTFQERALARRIVHFCAGTVLFECNTLRASELDPAGAVYKAKPHLRTDGTIRTPAEIAAVGGVDDRLIPGTAVVQDPSSYTYSRHGAAMAGNQPMRYRTVRTMVLNPDYQTLAEKQREFFRTAATRGMRGDFQLLFTAGQTQTIQEKVEFHSAWFGIVRNYSVRNITKNTDRLKALVGIANSIQSSCQGRKFVAGAWEETLALNLLWHTVHGLQGPGPGRRVRSEKLAATWSWASTVGGVGVETKLRDLQQQHANAPSEEYPNIFMLVSEVKILFDRVKRMQDNCIVDAALSLNQDFRICFRDGSHVERFEDEPIKRMARSSCASLVDGLYYLPIVQTGECERAGYFVSKTNQQDVGGELSRLPDGEQLVLI
ncbi:hypothetical protein PG990_000005 [Apiospora arundinis]